MPSILHSQRIISHPLFLFSSLHGCEIWRGTIPQCSLSTSLIQLYVRKIKKPLHSFERRALSHLLLDRAVGTPVKPLVHRASSRLSPWWWDREGSAAGVPAEEHERSGTHRSPPEAVWFVFKCFSTLCSLKRCSIFACPQEDVCFGSRNGLINEGIGGDFCSWAQKYFLQEPCFYQIRFLGEWSAFWSDALLYLTEFFPSTIKKGCFESSRRSLHPVQIFVIFQW